MVFTLNANIVKLYENNNAIILAGMQEPKRVVIRLMG